MADESRVGELVARWDRLRAEGIVATAEELCAGCPELADAVRRRIQALAAMDQLLDLGAGDTDPLDTIPGPVLPAGEFVAPDGARLGLRYRPLRLHARGGLGEVFIAQDEEVRREVALKRIQRPHDTHADSRRRFVREAEITGRLEHPGVVPVYGLGADADGRPFYAMRFIAGQTLQQAFEQLHDAGRPDRDAGTFGRELRPLLGRFVAVCNTVAYAHNKGVIHRDLKPSNVMLGPYGETLVVDWGLAKPVAEAERTGDTPLGLTVAAGAGTQAGSAIGTPAYMGPEQAAGDVDPGPAGDVFGLGATLYALLTGRAPYQAAQVYGVIDQARRGAFPPPRQVKPAVPRALEAVCLKAMALIPADRYASALELAADVERWLADEPVSAWREPWGVRAWRWVRRNRSWVLAGSAAVVLVVVTLAVATALLTAARGRERDAKLQAQQQRDAARANFQLARQAVDDYFTKVSQDALLKVPRMKPLRERLLRTALAFHQKFLDEAGDDPAVRAERAYAFARLAAVTEELGEPAKAAQLYREAIAALQPLVDEQPSAREYRVRLAATCRGLGLVLLRQTQARAAEPLFRQTLDLYQALAAEFPGDPAYQYHQAMSHNDLASVHLTVGEREPMKAALDEGLRLCRAAVAARPQDRAYQAGEADLHTNLARWYQLNDQVDGAEPELLTAVQLYQQLADAHPDEVFYQSNLADAQNRLAQSYIFRGSDVAAKAVPAFQKAVAGYEQLVRREPWVPKYQRDLAGLHLDLGSWYFERERWKEAESAYEAARATARKLADDYRDDVDNQIFLAKIMRNVGMIQAKQRRWADAEASYRESIAIKERLVGEYPEFVDHAFALGSTYSDLAMLLEDVSRFGESLECYTKAIGLLDGVFAKVATRSVGRDNLRNTLWGRANVLNKLGRHAEALADWDRALEWAGGEGFRVELRSHRARTLALLGDHERAAAEARAVAATNPVKGKVLYRLAAAFAVSAAACARDGLPERERLADDYAAAALTQLRKAAEAGYFKDQSVVDQLRRDADFAALTSAEFKKWLAELTAR